YLEDRLLLDRAEVNADGVRIAEMRYRAVIVEDEALLTPGVRGRLGPMLDAGRVVTWDGGGVANVDASCERDVRVATPSPGLRFRHVVKGGDDFYLFFNERKEPIDTPV